MSTSHPLRLQSNFTRSGIAALATALLSYSTPAVAQLANVLGAPIRHSALPVTATLEITGDFPVALGGDLRIEVPFVDIYGGVGTVPSAFSRVYAQVANSFGASAAQTSMMQAIGDGGVSAHVGLALRPSVGNSLVLGVAYEYLNFSPTLSTTLVSEATGLLMAGTSVETLHLGIQLHALRMEVGYRWVFADHWTFRFAVGWLHTLRADARVSLDTNPDPVYAERLETARSAFEGDLKNGLNSYGFTPFVNLAVGYRL